MSTDCKVAPELELAEPSQDLLDWARDNIGENPETKCQVISDLRDMIYARGECVPTRTDDAFLIRFLRARNFIVERAHRLFVNYHDFKESNPQFWKDVDLAGLKLLGENYVISVPPYRDASGRRMIHYRIGMWNPETFSVDQMFQATLAILEMAAMEEKAQILGGLCLFDLGDLSMQHVLCLTPNVARKMVQLMVTSFPMKIRALHIVNQSYIFDLMYNMFKPFLTEAMKKRIFFHGEDFESLHKHIDPKYLPDRYGGIHPDYNYNDWIVYCRQNEKLVKEMRALGYTDSELDALEKNQSNL